MATTPPPASSQLPHGKEFLRKRTHRVAGRTPVGPDRCRRSRLDAVLVEQRCRALTSIVRLDLVALILRLRQLRRFCPGPATTTRRARFLPWQASATRAGVE